MAGGQHVLLEGVRVSGRARVKAERLATSAATKALIAAFGMTVPHNAVGVCTVRAEDCLRRSGCNQSDHTVTVSAQHRGSHHLGLKVCVIVTEAGAPVEFVLAPASSADITTLRSMNLHLPEGSELFGDTGFLDTELERVLGQQEAGLVRLVVPRRSNMKEQLDGCLEYVCGVSRKRVETTFSQLTERLARSIHAVTGRGFELKIMLTVLAFSLLG